MQHALISHPVPRYIFSIFSNCRSVLAKTGQNAGIAYSRISPGSHDRMFPGSMKPERNYTGQIQANVRMCFRSVSSVLKHKRQGGCQGANRPVEVAQAVNEFRRGSRKYVENRRSRWRVCGVEDEVEDEVKDEVEDEVR